MQGTLNLLLYCQIMTIMFNVNTRTCTIFFPPRYTDTFGVAVNRSWRNQQSQEWEEQTSFFNVVAWRQLAENIGASLSKGSRVVVSGRLEQRSWENDQGEKRSIVEIVADDVAASLRFATAEVHKVERSGPSDGGGGGGGPRPAPVGGGSSGGSNSYDDYGEEPF